jgi:hypothetical protein
MLALLLVALGPVGPVPMDTAHYHITSTTKSDLDLSAMGQPPQSVVITISAFVSATMSDSAGGKAIHVRIDSSTFDGGSAAAYLPPEMTADPRGAVYDVIVVNGRPVSRLTPTPMSMQAAQLAPAVALLFAGLRTSHAGDSWVDTVRSDSTIANAASSGSTITTWTVKPGTGDALEFDGTWAGTTSVGSGQMQMELQVNGTNQAAASPGSLSTHATSTGTGKANMTLAGQAVPMQVTTQLTADRVP